MVWRLLFNEHQQGRPCTCPVVALRPERCSCGRWVGGFLPWRYSTAPSPSAALPWNHRDLLFKFLLEKRP